MLNDSFATKLWLTPTSLKSKSTFPAMLFPSSPYVWKRCGVKHMWHVEARAMMREVQQQAILRVQRWRIGFLLCHWHSHTQSCKAGRQRLQQLHTHAQQQRYTTCAQPSPLFPTFAALQVARPPPSALVPSWVSVLQSQDWSVYCVPQHQCCLYVLKQHCRKMHTLARPGGVLLACVQQALGLTA